MNKEVEQALASIRPALQDDGGDVQLVSVQNGIVKVRLTGRCGSCPMAIVTLKQGIEMRLKELVPGVKQVEAV